MENNKVDNNLNIREKKKICPKDFNLYMEIYMYQKRIML